MCSEKQAWKIYYLIYGDKKNSLTGLYESTKSQEIIRENIEEKNPNIFEKYTTRFHVVANIQEKLTKDQAIYVIQLLLDRKYKKAEDILTKIGLKNK